MQSRHLSDRAECNFVQKATTRAIGADYERDANSYERCICQIASRASSLFEHTHKAALKAVSKPFSQ